MVEPEKTGDARATLMALAQDREVSLSRLSRLIGRNPSYLQQFIRKGSPRKLEEGDRRTLAQFFGISEVELRGEDGAAQDISYNLVGTGASREWADIDRLDVEAAAGPGAVPLAEGAFDTIRFSRRWLADQGLEGAQLSAIAVKGDSMEPLLRDGDEILVDRREQPFRDGIHIVRLGDTLMVKRVARSGVGRFTLISENPAYPPIDVAAEDFAPIGRVVWKGGRI